MLVSMGVDVRTVAGRLGHSGTGMLAKHYAVDLGDKHAAELFHAATDRAIGTSDSEAYRGMGRGIQSVKS